MKRDGMENSRNEIIDKKNNKTNGLDSDIDNQLS